MNIPIEIRRFAQSLSGRVGWMRVQEFDDPKDPEEWLNLAVPYTGREGDLPGVQLVSPDWGRLIEEPSVDFGLQLFWDDSYGAVLNHLGSLHALCVSRLSTEGVTAISQVPNLRFLRIRRTKEIDRLAELSKLSQLEALDLERVNLSHRNVEDLAKLTSLRMLSLANTEVADDAIQRIANLEKLEILNLNGLNLTQKGIGHLRAFQNLRTLNLRLSIISELSPERLSALADLPKLETLRLFITSDDDLEQLSICKSLKKLEFDGWDKVTQKGLKSLSRFESLRISCPELKPETLHHIVTRNPLTELRFVDCPISDRAVDEIAKLGELQQLEMTRTEVDDKSLRKLVGLGNLRELTFVNNPGLGLGFEAISQCDTLESVHIFSDAYLARESLKGWESLIRLRRLDIGESVSDPAIQKISKLPNLEYLRLPTKFGTRMGFQAVGQMMKLRELDLSFSSVKDEYLSAFEGMQNLQELSLSFTKVSDEKIEELRGKLPNCRVY